MKNANPVWYVVIALTIWCTWNSVKSSNSFAVLATLDTQVSVMTREVGFLMDRLQVLEEVKPADVIKEVEIPAEVKEVEIPAEVKAIIE
mgnify:CR=1 FL=1|tara:strand:+ start:1172 stop:1438 length:267 start_codon:yes stop_codon:yes gene_type:complete